VRAVASTNVTREKNNTRALERRAIQHYDHGGSAPRDPEGPQDSFSYIAHTHTHPRATESVIMKVAFSSSSSSFSPAAAAAALLLLLLSNPGHAASDAAAVADATIAAPSLLRGGGAAAAAAAAVVASSSSSGDAGRALYYDQQTCWNAPSIQNATQVPCTLIFLSRCQHGVGYFSGSQQEALIEGIDYCQSPIMFTYFDPDANDDASKWNVECCYY
jgi:hypothetical protein